MNRQQRLLLWILFVYIIEVQQVTNGYSITRRIMVQKLAQINQPDRCPEIENDEDVVTSREFTIPLNTVSSQSKSYGSMDKNGYITRLKIINEMSIPPTIFGLKHLEQLEIRRSCFFPCEKLEIPSEIECLASSLTELGIYDTKITHLPDEITKLVHLKTLKLSNTGLMSLPDAIGNFKFLSQLYLPKNDLKSLPNTIADLQSLEELTLSNNPNLHSIEPLHDLHSLTFLDTRHSPIEILPRNLPKLSTLYMSNNNLTNLNGIGTLGTGSDTVKDFYFDRNSIQFIPPSIREVNNLRWLKLDHNNLQTLPKEIFSISTLSYFDISYNQFQPRHLKDLISKFRQKNPKLQILYQHQRPYKRRRI